MRRLSWLLLVMILALPLSALAQDDSYIDITGEYSFEGEYADSGETYSGTMTIEGEGSLYWATFTSGDSTQTVPMLRLGNVAVQGYNDVACSPTIYTQLESGDLLGMWVDGFYYDSVGIELLIPEGETDGFAGDYGVQGVYGTSDTYSGVVNLSLDDAGLFAFNIPAADGGEVVAGYGFQFGDVLAIVQTLDVDEVPMDGCGVWVGEFYADGTYSAMVMDGGLATEAGSRVE